MAADSRVAGDLAVRAGRPLLSYLGAAALVVAGLVQFRTLIKEFLPSDVQFQAITTTLAVVAAVGALLQSRVARAIVTAAAGGGLIAVALWPPWPLLDSGHPLIGLTGFGIFVLTGASLAAGWREKLLPTGRNLMWLIAGGGAAGWFIVSGVLVVILVWVVIASSWTF